MEAAGPGFEPLAGQQSIGVVALHGPDADAAIEVRAYFNDGGRPLREDPVTGSLKASVPQCLIRSGRVKAPYLARQGSRIGRDGRELVTEANDELWIGGPAVVVTGAV